MAKSDKKLYVVTQPNTVVQPGGQPLEVGKEVALTDEKAKALSNKVQLKEEKVTRSTFDPEKAQEAEKALVNLTKERDNLLSKVASLSEEIEKLRGEKASLTDALIKAEEGGDTKALQKENKDLKSQLDKAQEANKAMADQLAKAQAPGA